MCYVRGDIICKAEYVCLMILLLTPMGQQIEYMSMVFITGNNCVAEQ